MLLPLTATKFDKLRESLEMRCPRNSRGQRIWIRNLILRRLRATRFAHTYKDLLGVLPGSRRGAPQCLHQGVSPDPSRTSFDWDCTLGRASAGLYGGGGEVNLTVFGFLPWSLIPCFLQLAAFPLHHFPTSALLDLSMLFRTFNVSSILTCRLAGRPLLRPTKTNSK